MKGKESALSAIEPKPIASFYAVAQRTVSLCCNDDRLAVFGRFINILYVGIHDFSLNQIVE